MTPSIFIFTVWGVSIIGTAGVLDMLFGDPENLPHPVRLIGSTIEHGEKFCRKIPVGEVIQGTVLTIGITVLTYTITASILEILKHRATWAAWIFSVLIIYFSIALRCLADEALAVQYALESKDLEAARCQVSRLVGRDTSSLDESGVAMAAIETVAENLVDGMSAPLFYACLFGPAMCAAYRAINTLDAMVGYKDQRYIKFGKVAARLDDLTNWLPARFTVVAICIASRITGIGTRGEIRRVVRSDSRSHSSPNSGFPESAFAAALGVRLGGPAVYHGKATEYPWINAEYRRPSPADIHRAVKLLYATAGTIYAGALVPGLVISLWIA